MSSPTSRPIPKQLGGFEVLRRLGVGGMAEVFLAKKRGAEGTYKLLVLKRILPSYGGSRRFRTMFADEAQLATRLNHPNIVQVYDFQDYGDHGQLLSMEYVEGPDLKKLMRAAQSKGRRVPPFVSAYLISEVAKGLHYAHERRDEKGAPLDIVHRDVSPQNVLLSYDGSVKIADFGIATANIFREEPGVLKGKTSYMSPEQARAEKLDRRSDIYSLGVVLHELLAGRQLYGGADGPDVLELVRAGHVEAPSTYATDVPPELEAVVMKALAAHPEQRFQTARELVTAITRALFARQEIVDGHVLETVIQELSPREEEPEGEAPESGPLMVVTGAEAAAPLSEHTPVGDTTGLGRGLEARPTTRGREVRNVAVVVFRLHGLERLRRRLGGAAERSAEQLLGVLDEIAFKHEARWAWPPAPTALERLAGMGRAVVGLTADSSRAARGASQLAVATHEALAAFADDVDVPLEASIGVARAVAAGRRDRAGHLVSHELQEPAHYLTTLLGGATPPGRTWVAGGLYRLVRRDFVWSEAPSLVIDDPIERDLPQMMRVYALERPLTRDEWMRSAGGDFVGRDAELAELHAAYHRALSATGSGGLGQIVARVVLGDMGIGKSTLVRAFTDELPGETRVVRVEATPSKELPLSGAVALIRGLVGIEPEQGHAEAAGRLRAALGELQHAPDTVELVARLTELALGRLPTANDEAEGLHNRRLLSVGLRRLVAQLALEQPVVIVFDGLQWADRQSLELLAELLRMHDRLPLLVLLVSRPDERVGELIEGLVRVELQGLAGESMLALLRAHLGDPRGVAEACAELLPRAAGNPFFLLEMVDALLERGHLELRDLGDGEQELVVVERPGQPARPLPSTLEQLIADRLHELPEAEQEIVRWLAIAGLPLSEAALIELVNSEVEEAITRLCARGLCDERSGELEFRHPLTRDVAYLAIPSGERTERHRRLATVLAETPIATGLTAAIVARHFARGEAKEEAVRYYFEAASAARASYQVPLATRYYRRGLALLPGHDLRRLEAHEALEELARMQGHWRERKKHLEALRSLARRSEHGRWVATALLRSARYDSDVGRLARGLVAAEQAERVARACGSAVSEVQAQALAAEALRDLGDMQGALSACDRALATVDRRDVPARLRAEVLRTRGTLLLRVGRVDESIEALAESIAVFRQVGARRQEARARNALAQAMHSVGRFEDAIALALEAIRIDLAIGGRFQIARTLGTIGAAYAALGDGERGLAYLRRAREAHERYGDQDARAETLLATAELHIASGQLDVADGFLRDAAALVAVTGSGYDGVRTKLLRAAMARGTGDPSSAVLYAFEARQTAEAQAFVAFHFYAMALEAISRVDVGEQHTGILLATTALGSIETIGGSEYALETRCLCCAALSRAGSPRAPELARRSATFARTLAGSIRDSRLRELFLVRPVVQELFAAEREADAADAQIALVRPLLPDVEALGVGIED